MIVLVHEAKCRERIITEAEAYVSADFAAIYFVRGELANIGEQLTTSLDGLYPLSVV